MSLEQTERTKQVLAFAEDEARRLGHNYLGTEHLVLAVIRAGTGVGWYLLARLGVHDVDLERARKEVVDMLEGPNAGYEVTSPDGKVTP